MWVLFFILFNFQVDAKKRVPREAPVRSEIRCAVDVGSGETKYVIGQVVLQGHVVKEVKKIILNRRDQVKIKAEVKDEVLSTTAVENLRKSLVQFKKECEVEKGVKISGVATSGFRAAKKNGSEVLKKIKVDLGIPILILTGEEEGLIGLQSLQGLVDEKIKNWIVWDMGGGSQQLGAKIDDRQIVDSINMGADAYRDELIKFLGRKNKESLYPITAAEVEKIAAWTKDFSKLYGQELRLQIGKIGSPVYAVGGPFAGISETLGTESLTIEALQTHLIELTGLTFEELSKKVPDNKYPYNLFSNLLLVKNLADAFGFKKINFIKDVHLGTGLLKSDLYWN